MKRCYLVRHAQTIWNHENRLQGHTDQPLSPLGERQAVCLGEAFASRHLLGVFTSALGRSRRTAEAIVQGNGHGVTPVVHDALAEMHLGAWEGLTPEEIDAQFDGAYRDWRRAPSTVVIPSAEPVAAFRRRVRGVFAELAGRVDEGEYVVVTHGGVIASFLADLLGAEYDTLLRRLRLDNAGITAIDATGPRPHVLWVNATTHLERLAAEPLPGTWY